MYEQFENLQVTPAVCRNKRKRARLSLDRMLVIIHHILHTYREVMRSRCHSDIGLYNLKHREVHRRTVFEQNSVNHATAQNPKLKFPLVAPDKNTS